MGDEHYTLSSILLNSLLFKEQNLKITPNISTSFNVKKFNKYFFENIFLVGIGRKF